MAQAISKDSFKLRIKSLKKTPTFNYLEPQTTLTATLKTSNAKWIKCMRHL